MSSGSPRRAATRPPEGAHECRIDEGHRAGRDRGGRSGRPARRSNSGSAPRFREVPTPYRRAARDGVASWRFSAASRSRSARHALLADPRRAPERRGAGDDDTARDERRRGTGRPRRCAKAKRMPKPARGREQRRQDPPARVERIAGRRQPPATAATMRRRPAAADGDRSLATFSGNIGQRRIRAARGTIPHTRNDTITDYACQMLDETRDFAYFAGQAAAASRSPTARYDSASARWMRPTVSAPSRSASVRATLRTR